MMTFSKKNLVMNITYKSHCIVKVEIHHIHRGTIRIYSRFLGTISNRLFQLNYGGGMLLYMYYKCSRSGKLSSLLSSSNSVLLSGMRVHKCSLYGQLNSSNSFPNYMGSLYGQQTKKKCT